MLTAPRTAIFRYGLSLVAVLLAVSVRLAMGGIVGDRLPFATLFLAVLVVAGAAGRGPALVTTALGAIAADLLLLGPPVSLGIDEAQDRAGLVLYLLVGSGIAHLGGVLREARRRAEVEAEAADLRRRELRITLDSIGDGVLVSDVEGRIVSLNPAAEVLTGWTTSEAAGRPLPEVFRIIDEDTRETVVDPSLRSLRVEATVGLPPRTVLIARDGSERPIDDSAAPIRDGSGAVVGTVLVFRDIGARRRIEAEARRGGDRAQTILESISDAFCSLDRDWRFVYVNRHAESILGRRADELLGRCYWDIFPDTAGTEVERNYRRARDEGVALSFETYYPPHDRWYEFHAYPSPEGLSIYFRDVSGRRRAEESEQRFRAEAAAADARFRAFFEQGAVLAGILDVDGTLLETNRLALEGCGYTREQAIGRPFWEGPWWSPSPELAARIREATARAGAGETFRDELPYFVAGGVERVVDMILMPIKDDAGRVILLAPTGTDISDRRRAEERARFQAHLLDTVGQAVIVTDPSGLVTYWNRAAEALYGWTAAEAVGREILDLVARPDDVGPGADIMDRVRDGTSWSGEFNVRRRDGSTFPALVSDTPVFDAAGRLEAIVGVSIDLSERKRAEEALRRSEERLRLIVESAADYAIFAIDLDGKVTSWNAGARNILGYEEDEILGRDVAILFLPEDIDRGVPQQEARRAIELGRAEDERWHRRKDGTLFWASGLLAPMREAGQVVGLLKVMRDTTEQKRTEQELEVSRERLNLVVNSSEVGLWYCDLPFDTLVWNPKCKEHFGLAPDAVVTIDTFFERIHPDDREPTRKAIDRSIRECTEYDIEFRTLDPAGPFRWVRAIGQPFYDVEGTPVRFDGITVDVSQRIAQEEVLREADRRKNEFLATLAHELRNPLAPIRNALRLMRDPSDPGHEAERAMAERQVVHLARLIDDLMDVARISRGKIELNRVPVDLGTIITQAVETARPLIEERRHRLSVSLPNAPIQVEGDPTRLEQILWNLLNNAAKYTEPGGRIDLVTAREDDWAVVRIRDDGIGIGPEMLSRIFEMFVQVGGHEGRSQGGLGIGLSLVRTLVEMHGGSISARSDGPGAGTEFEVRLPALPVATPAPAPPTAGDDRRPEGPPRHRVLVVDDNVDAARSLARLLERLYGQEVRVAYDGPAALALADAFRPAAVLLDIGLPGMDGNEVARALRSRSEFAGALLVALTGWGQEADVERSRAAGFDHHLVKPADPAAIAELLARHPSP